MGILEAAPIDSKGGSPHIQDVHYYICMALYSIHLAQLILSSAHFRLVSDFDNVTFILGI